MRSCRRVGQCRGAHIGECIADAGGCRAAVAAAMIPISSSARIWIAMGHTDMRKGMRSLALQVQHDLNHDVHAGDLYVFRERSGSLCKILWHDGVGMSLFAKRLERGKFIWPSAKDGVVAISASAMACGFAQAASRLRAFWAGSRRRALPNSTASAARQAMRSCARSDRKWSPGSEPSSNRSRPLPKASQSRWEARISAR